MAPDSGAPIRRGGAVLGRGPASRLTLHLGVLVQPYRNNGLTTADVARFLEEKYGVMAAYYRVHGDVVRGAVAKSMEGAIESLVMGRRVDPWGYATQLIQREFRAFISSKQAEQVGMPGTPTKAALRGVNHRLKHPYARRNPRRPSFRDTGLYMADFRAWID
ncbi:MAG TPA: hypothetical protein VI653_05010 [Steroidobacteraceae bacterium]